MERWRLWPRCYTQKAAAGLAQRRLSRFEATKKYPHAARPKTEEDAPVRLISGNQAALSNGDRSHTPDPARIGPALRPDPERLANRGRAGIPPRPERRPTDWPVSPGTRACSVRSGPALPYLP
jgi:hypothetical protein